MCMGMLNGNLRYNHRNDTVANDGEMHILSMYYGGGNVPYSYKSKEM